MNKKLKGLAIGNLSFQEATAIIKSCERAWKMYRPSWGYLGIQHLNIDDVDAKDWVVETKDIEIDFDE